MASAGNSPLRNDRTPVTTDSAGRQTARLRAAFLMPVVAVIVAMAALPVTELFVHERAEIEREVGRVRAGLNKMYQDDLAHNRAMLHAVMEVIQLDPALYRALARKDRAELMARTMPTFPRLNEKFHITQFYFSRPDRVNLLRVHRPEQHGDVIDRYTTLEAERTGMMARGVELDPHGTLTLRMVHPWYLEPPWHAGPPEHLIGYFELAMDIDHILSGVQGFLGVPVVVLVSKQHLERATWEAGMRERGRNPDWDRFPQTVLSLQAMHEVSPVAAAALARFPATEPDAAIEAEQGRESYRLTAAPLQDAAGRTVAWMVAVIDVSRHAATARRAVWAASLLALAASGALSILFWWQVGRVGRRLERDEAEKDQLVRKLDELATHDGLTGLYNHRAFDKMLEDEIARAKRFNRPVSLLMIDIDHFKHVNDTHGHQVGDAILKGLSDLLRRQSRAIDRVCRYGGEEITVILPEIENAAALNTAERLRAAVAQEPFDVGNGHTVRITVSIGLASWPAQAATGDALVGAADVAMYAAKQAGRNRVCRYEKGIAARGN